MNEHGYYIWKMCGKLIYINVDVVEYIIFRGQIRSIKLDLCQFTQMASHSDFQWKGHSHHEIIYEMSYVQIQWIKGHKYIRIRLNGHIRIAWIK